MELNITQKEVEALLKEIELVFRLPSIIEITPKELSSIEDNATREMMQRKFYLINELFVVPLQKLLNESISAVNKKSYCFDYSTYSLKQRIRLISKDLLIFGFKPADLCAFLPQTVEEVDRRVKEIEARRALRVLNSKKSNIDQRKIS